MSRSRFILHELAEHIPFTAGGAVTGIILMVVIQLTRTPREVSESLFYIFHPLHVAFSAVIITAMYRRHQKKASIFLTILVGYAGAVGIATLSDALFPYL